MMRRLPLIPTLVVALAVAVMIWLGLWQLLDRLPEKRAYLEQLAANPAKPPVAYPDHADPSLLFRRAAGTCPPPVTVTVTGAGRQGFRAIGHCRAEGDGSGMIVQLGTSRDPLVKVTWNGGAVTGRIGQAPDARPWVAALFSRAPAETMLVADPPVAGLAPNQRPDAADIPNNHLSYAVQWFLFALTAVVIYALALRKRLRERSAEPRPSRRARAEAVVPPRKPR